MENAILLFLKERVFQVTSFERVVAKAASQRE
jgi:hypothetical protein